MPEITSSDLPESVSTADAATVERLFAAYSNPLCRFVYSYVRSFEVAEDLVDEIFLKLWQRLRRGEAVRDLKVYLFTAARNQAINHLRHRRIVVRHQERTLSGEFGHVEAAPAAIEQHLADGELTAALQRAVDLLPTRQRAVIVLKWRNHMSNDEVAATLGIAPTTVAEHYRRALKQLRVVLKDLR